MQDQVTKLVNPLDDGALHNKLINLLEGVDPLKELDDLLEDFPAEVTKFFGLWNSSHCRIVMLGLDAAGKTTILYKLRLNETVTTIPTIGFNVEEVKTKNVSFTVWDVGGQQKIRNLWHHYYAGSDALIFVVDSSDRDRLKEAAEELHGILNGDHMRAIPVVVFANKQDLPSAATPSELVDKLRLRELVHRNKWHVQASNAVSGEGLVEGIETVARLCRDTKVEDGAE